MNRLSALPSPPPRPPRGRATAALLGAALLLGAGCLSSDSGARSGVIDALGDAREPAADVAPSEDASLSDSVGSSDAAEPGGADVAAHWRDRLPTPPAFDCSTIPQGAPTQRVVAGARGYHGLAFDGEGALIGSDGTSLIRASADGQWSVWYPGVGAVEQIAFLPGGDLLAARADEPGLLRLSPSGGRRVLVSDLQLYGVLVGPDGMAYVAGYAGVWRVDPESGDHERLVDTPDIAPHSLAFNRDYSLLVVGVMWGGDDPGDQKITAAQIDACRGLSEGQGCSFLGDDQVERGGSCWLLDPVSGELVCWDDGYGGGRAEVAWLKERQAACAGAGARNGGACEFTPGDGAPVSGECVALDSGMSCWEIDFGEGGDLPASDGQRKACAGRDDGDPCEYLDADRVDTEGRCYAFDEGAAPECWRFEFDSTFDPWVDTPPISRDAIAACGRLAPGELCEYPLGGVTVSGECYPYMRASESVCWGQYAAYLGTAAQRQACLGQDGEQACEYVSARDGRVSGVCLGEAELGVSVCWDPDIVSGGGGAPSEPADLLAWSLDRDLNPVGEAQVYAAGMGGYHDALAFDLCGNLYVADYQETALFKVAPDHSWTKVLEWDAVETPLQSYGHAILWGSGEHGWRHDAIYVALPYADFKVKEVSLGVPGQRWSGSTL